jgi:hypothetical protein
LRKHEESLEELNEKLGQRTENLESLNERYEQECAKVCSALHQIKNIFIAKELISV